MSDITEFMLSRLDKLEDKMDGAHDKMMHQLDAHNKLLGDYNDSLREHMRRTRLLEDKVEPMYTEYSDKKIADKVNTKKWKNRLWILGGISTVIGILTGIASLMHLI